MRRHNILPLGIFIFSLAMIAAGIAFFWKSETGRISDVARIKDQPSAIYASLLMQYDRPPIYQEEYQMQDVEGVSTFQYRVRSYGGKQITLTAPQHVTTDVSFFFGKLVLDGVWNLMDKPPRGNTHVLYTVYVKQKADFKQGDRTIVFTDPHYWATTAGREYQINLKTTNPNDLLKLQSTQLADPHYQLVVSDFLTFGSQSFRDKIAQVRAAVMKASHS
jgi:hypothetical protein